MYVWVLFLGGCFCQGGCKLQERMQEQRSCNIYMYMQSQIIQLGCILACEKGNKRRGQTNLHSPPHFPISSSHPLTPIQWPCAEVARKDYPPRQRVCGGGSKKSSRETGSSPTAREWMKGGCGKRPLGKCLIQ